MLSTVVKSAEFLEKEYNFHTNVVKPLYSQVQLLPVEERPKLIDTIDGKVLAWQKKHCPESWNTFASHYMSEEGVAKFADEIYQQRPSHYIFNTGFGDPSVTNAGDVKDRLLKMFRNDDMPGKTKYRKFYWNCSIKEYSGDKGVLILECWGQDHGDWLDEDEGYEDEHNDVNSEGYEAEVEVSDNDSEASEDDSVVNDYVCEGSVIVAHGVEFENSVGSENIFNPFGPDFAACESVPTFFEYDSEDYENDTNGYDDVSEESEHEVDDDEDYEDDLKAYGTSSDSFDCSYES